MMTKKATLTERVTALESGIAAILAAVQQPQGGEVVEATPVDGLEALRNTAPRPLTNDIFEKAFKSRLKKAKAAAKENGIEYTMSWVANDKRDYVLYHSTPRKGTTLLATVRPDGSVKAHINGLDSYLKAA